LELAKSKKGREETEERYSNELNDLLEKVEMLLESERRTREDNTNKLMKKLNDEIGKYSDMIMLERKVREETQNTLFRMIEGKKLIIFDLVITFFLLDMESNLTREIDNERKEREENEESFMNLLEDTCARIERSLGSI
jgi:ElaB/YqjD/DUF883 family membrane-anchored ribosome-binding protein